MICKAPKSQKESGRIIINDIWNRLIICSAAFLAQRQISVLVKMPGLPWIWISMDISMCGYEIKAVLWIYPWILCWRTC